MDSLEWRGARWHDARFRKRIQKEFQGRWKNYDAIYVHGSVELAAEVANHRPTVLRLPGPASDEQASLLHSIHVVCANGDVLARSRRLIGEKVVELPVGLDAVAFSPEGPSMRSALEWTSEHKVIGYVGRITRLKGVDLLADAFRDVAAVCPEARLLVIGRGEEEKSFRHVLLNEIAGGKVHFVPSLTSSELGPWYRAMDLFVLPSRYENFSNALLEASACGVPFVAADVGGNQILQKSGAGFLFAPGSSADLAHKIRECFADMESSRARSLAFSRVVREQYDWNVSAERMDWILKTRLTDAGRSASIPAITPQAQLSVKL
jgi:glycosyltransferase involved in cell wall biosynthesis